MPPRVLDPTQQQLLQSLFSAILARDHASLATQLEKGSPTADLVASDPPPIMFQPQEPSSSRPSGDGTAKLQGEDLRRCLPGGSGRRSGWRLTSAIS